MGCQEKENKYVFLWNNVFLPTILTSKTRIALKASSPSWYIKMGSREKLFKQCQAGHGPPFIVFQMDCLWNAGRVNLLADTHLCTSFAKVFLIVQKCSICFWRSEHTTAYRPTFAHPQIRSISNLGLGRFQICVWAGVQIWGMEQKCLKN